MGPFLPCGKWCFVCTPKQHHLNFPNDNNKPSAVLELPGEVHLPFLKKKENVEISTAGIIDHVLLILRPSGRLCSNFVAAHLSWLCEAAIRIIHFYDNWPEGGGVPVIMP